jgi:hypothetical protein
MASGGEVLTMLIPTGGWTIYDNDFDSIIYDEGVQPITKKQFEDGFTAYDNWQAEQEATKATAKASALAKLAALGLSADEIAAL